MAEGDPALPATPAVSPTSSALDIHPKVSVAIFAGALTAVVLGVCKQRGLDLSGYESNITVIVMGLVGYLTPSN